MAFNNEDILTLAKAGFTAAQIAALSQVGNVAPSADTTAQPVTDAPTAPAPAPTAPAPAPTAPAPAPAPVPQGATVDDVLKSVKDLTATFQNGFIMGSQQPKPVTAEDILANIINPPSKTKEV